MQMAKTTPNNQLLRQHILHRTRNMMDTPQTGMYPGPMSGQSQGTMGHPMAQPQGENMIGLTHFLPLNLFLITSLVY